jgi:uncharacterized membrane protein required for colicin V production
MTWLDVTVVALFVVLGFVEAKRGAIPAAIDLALALTGLGLAKSLTPVIGAVGGTEAAPFLGLMVLVVLITGITSTVTDLYTKWDIGPFDAAVGGVCGVIVGLVLGHAAFHAATLAGGHTALTASKSLLVVEVYDLRTFDALTGMMHNLGSGPRIADEVKEQQN